MPAGVAGTTVDCTLYRSCRMIQSTDQHQYKGALVPSSVSTVGETSSAAHRIMGSGQII